MNNFSYLWKFEPDVRNYYSFGEIIFETPQIYKECKGSLGNLSKDVSEGRTSTGSEPFSLFICLDANKFVLLSFFSLMKGICPRVSNKSLPNDAKGPLPVDVRRSTMLLLKLPINVLPPSNFAF